MDISIEISGPTALVDVAGDIEAGNASQLRYQVDTVLVDGVRNVVMDIAQVSFMDSSGIATLVQVFKKVREGQGSFHLCNVAPQVLRVFELTQLDRVFSIFPHREEATSGLLGEEDAAEE